MWKKNIATKMNTRSTPLHAGHVNTNPADQATTPPGDSIGSTDVHSSPGVIAISLPVTPLHQGLSQTTTATRPPMSRGRGGPSLRTRTGASSNQIGEGRLDFVGRIR